MAIKDIRGYQWITSQLFELAEKPAWSQADKARNSNLIALRAALSEGCELRDLQIEELRELEQRHGLPLTPRIKRDEENAQVREMRTFRDFAVAMLEKRDETVGTLANTNPGWLNGNAYGLVPRAFLAGVRAQQKWADPMCDGDTVSLLTTTHARTIQAAYYDDSSIVATQVSENQNLASLEQDIVDPYAVDIQAYSYRSPLWRMSWETLVDLEDMTTAFDLFSRFAADRMGRGAGKNLLLGTGGGTTTLGLIPSLIAAGAQANVATGSSESTGGSQTGSNSIGVTDLQVLMNSVDHANQIQKKCAWGMNLATKQFLGSILDKMGAQIKIIEHRPDGDYIFGHPIKVFPSMASIGPAQIPIIFGDLGAWCSRTSVGTDYVRMYFQTLGLAEKAEFGLRLFQRWDGALLSNGNSTTPPIRYTICHS